MAAENGRPITFALGKVLQVLVDEARAVFLEVSLVHYLARRQEPLTALVRWCPTYHGPDFSDSWVPPTGVVVLCLFPLLADEGGGPDLDSGYAFSVVPGDPAPPPAGRLGPLSDSRRVYLGRDGEDHDVHLRGDLDHRIEENETREVGGDRELTINGNETRTILGDQEETVAGSRTTIITGDDSSTHVGLVARVFQAAVSWAGAALIDLVTTGLFRISGTLGVTIVVPPSAKILLGADLVGALKRLMTEDMIAVFNNHRHSAGSPFTGPPDSTLNTTHATDVVRGL